MANVHEPDFESSSNRPGFAGRAVVSFPVGEDGAHQIANFSSEDARVLMVSEMTSPEIALYPDSGKVMAREQPPGQPPTGYRKLFREADETDYWEGERPPDPSAP